MMKPDFPIFRVTVLLLSCLMAAMPARTAESADNWLDVVRDTPYWESRGVASNLSTVRRWVLLGDSYCSEAQRHLLLDHRWRFIGYIDNTGSIETNLEKLNETRRRLAEEGRVSTWHAGARLEQGYPFALSCFQPFVDMPDAIARLTGSEAEYRLWGTWDGISVGAQDNQVSLIRLFHEVLRHRREQGRFSFPETMMPIFLGKIIIESGGQKDALSQQAARGIMQLRPEVLDDCEIPPAYRLHRIVQVDCALRLVEQNHRNLRGPFEATFGHLPEGKRERLYDLLLTQAYQIGVGRSIELLQDDTLGQAAAYFATHHEDFSAHDILVGMIYHNMGRRDLGLLSLYYVTDSRLALEALCSVPAMQADAWCAGEAETQ